MILAAPRGSITPAGALIAANGLTSNGSALGDLNGVAVEAVIIPEAAIR